MAVAPDWGLLLTAFFASLPVVFTPGPNNIICAAIGASHGYRRALPFSLGVTVGFPVVLAAVGAGLASILRHYPDLQFFAKIAGVSFLAYLAVRIALAPPPRAATAVSPQGFVHAFLWQWLNPKGVSYALSLVALYVRPHALVTDVLMLMAMTSFLSFVSTNAWILAGAAIGRFLHSPRRHRIFSVVMGGLLLAAAGAIFFQ